MTDVKRVFKVNGEPFYPIGGEWLYMSGYSVRNESETDEAFNAIKLIHGNTMAVDIYWDQIEPEEGKFDFTSLDSMIARARTHQVKLLLLWFATWKNGNMDFTPSWIKSNPKRFRRVVSPTGGDIWVLSPHCKSNLEADKQAFKTLCKHLKIVDIVEHTVIGIQVENEPGILGSDRDYGPEAQAIFESMVPDTLVTAIKKNAKGKLYELWREVGSKEIGTWSDLFGWEAGEIMTAWSIAAYIDSVAEVGKENYDFPMFINVWLLGQRWWPLPGEAYPSGGAVTTVLDIYKWFTPHIDLIAPDIYAHGFKGFESICAAYSREDNPLFLVETIRGPNMLVAVADYNLIGYFTSGLEWIDNKKHLNDAQSQTNIDVCRSVAAVIPLLLKYQGTGKIHAVIQEAGVTQQSFNFDGYFGQVIFGPVNLPYRTKREIIGIPTGWGLIIQTNKTEFFLVGDNYQLFLRPKPSVDKMRTPLIVADWRNTIQANSVSVEEGHFDQEGKYIAECRRNGDLIKLGLWVEPNVCVVRAIMCE